MSCVESVTVHPRSVTIRTGSWYYDARAEVYPPDADCTDVEWYSDNYNIASVGASSGYIHGLTPGTTRVYAEATDGSGIRDYITVTVQNYIEVESVTLNRTNITLEKGDCFPLVATVCPGNATKPDVSWRSTNTSVATVSNGVVKAKSHGSAYIYAEATDGSGVSASCRVYVTEDILVSSVTVRPSSMTMRVGTSDFLHVTVCPEDATDNCVVWSSSNPGVATVISDSGLVFAHSVGQTTIRATPRDGGADAGECVLTVEPAIPVEGVGVYPTSLTMCVGDTGRVFQTIYPPEATNKRVTWRSSDEDVASVDYYTGEITANSAGTATITATTVDGEFTAECTVTVKIERVTIKKDGFYNNVVFESSGKVWKCVNFDLVFNEENRLDTMTMNRAYHNFFTYFDEEDDFNSDKTPKEYTDDEIKLLYAIDPYGVAHYVNKYAELTKNGLEDILEYKDDIFRLLFGRDPKYFARTLEGVWYEVTEYEEINDVLSESETIFGMHPIYDARTWIELLQFASTIIGIAFGTTFIGQMISTGINIITTVHVVALATDFDTVKNELAGYISGTVMGQLIEEHFKDTIIDWANNYVSLYDSLQDLSDAMTLDLSYSKAVINYCACDTGYDVLFEMKNGTTYRLHDVCDLINQ